VSSQPTVPPSPEPPVEIVAPGRSRHPRRRQLERAARRIGAAVLAHCLPQRSCHGTAPQFPLVPPAAASPAPTPAFPPDELQAMIVDANDRK